MPDNRPNQKNTAAHSDINSGRNTHIGDKIYQSTYIEGQTLLPVWYIN